MHDAYTAFVQATLRHRGREITEDDIAFMQGLIAGSPRSSRRALSKQVCEAWGWRQTYGTLRDMVCRSMMLMLPNAGRIELPPIRRAMVNYVIAKRRPVELPPDLDRTPLELSFAELGAVEWRQVRRTPYERLFDALIATFHCLGPVELVGEHLKFLVLARGRPIACLTWSSPPHKLNPRDHFIGWSQAARDHNRQLIAYNPRRRSCIARTHSSTRPRMAPRSATSS